MKHILEYNTHSEIEELSDYLQELFDKYNIIHRNIFHHNKDDNFCWDIFSDSIIITTPVDFLDSINDDENTFDKLMLKKHEIWRDLLKLKPFLSKRLKKEVKYTRGSTSYEIHLR